MINKQDQTNLIQTFLPYMNWHNLDMVSLAQRPKIGISHTVKNRSTNKKFNNS